MYGTYFCSNIFQGIGLQAPLYGWVKDELLQLSISFDILLEAGQLLFDSVQGFRFGSG